jgi:glycosyltransferase involved in cell wall biosynthesis
MLNSDTARHAVSVALCTYNGVRFLPEQLRSIRAQTRPPDELVVCDDCSTDGTLEVLRAFAADAPFPVRVTVNGCTLGSTVNFERAIGMCSGSIVLLADQDDVWRCDKLDRFAAAFADPNVALVASDLAVIGPSGEPLGRRMWRDLPFGPDLQAAVERGGGPRLWVRYNTVTGAAAGFRTSLRNMLLPIPPAWVHDAWIAFLAAAVGDVRLIREPLTLYRSHPEQQIGCEPLAHRRRLSREVRTARKRDRGHFTRLADAYAELADRLERFRNFVRDPDLTAFVRRKAMFLCVQARMREDPRVARVWPALRELFRGHYHRYSRGLKAFAADLLL